MRTIAMALVMLAVIWAFWKNNENIIERLQGDQAFWDETEQAGSRLKSFARDFVETLEREYGVHARIQVRTARLAEPEVAEGELFLGLCPAERQVVLRMNPVDDAGRALIREMQEHHFNKYWDIDWRDGLESALVVIWSHYSGEGRSFMDRVASDTAIEDETGTLSHQDLEFLARFASGLREDFGQQAVIRIFQGPVIMPELDSRTLFIGLSPEMREAMVVFPPLVERALPEGFARRLSTGHFPLAFDAGDWPGGLKAALVDIWRGLAGQPLGPGSTTNPTENGN
jgi:hypothetical protein